MAIMSVAEGRKFLKTSNLTDGQIKELLELMEDIAWSLLETKN